MNIREVIEKLQEMAARLPDGLHSEVRVAICNGNDPGLVTPSIEVDTMWTVNKTTSAVTDSFAIVQGHPHRDEGSGKTVPVTAEIDDLVEKWAADRQEGGAGGADPIMVKSDKEEYLLLPFSDGKFVKFPVIDGKPLLPGSPDAVAAGCLCDPERNNYGRGHRYDDGVQMVIKDGCPLHPKVDTPVDPDSE